MLEAQIQEGQKDVSLYQRQALLYARVGLIEQAQWRYIEVLDLSDESDLEQQAIVFERLGNLAYIVTDYADAIKWLTFASDIYQQHLDTSLPDVQVRLDEIEEKIIDARSRLPLPDEI